MCRKGFHVERYREVALLNANNSIDLLFRLLNSSFTACVDHTWAAFGRLLNSTSNFREICLFSPLLKIFETALFFVCLLVLDLNIWSTNSWKRVVLVCFCMCRYLHVYVHTSKRKSWGLCRAQPRSLTRVVRPCVSNLSDQLKSDLTPEKYGLLKLKQTHPIRIIQLFYFWHRGTGSVRKGCPLVSG